MTKKEITKILIEEHGYKASDLKGLKLDELENILKSCLDNLTVNKNQNVSNNDNFENTDSKVESIRYQLNIFETKIEHLKGYRKVIFENMGVGDIYVSTSKEGIFKKENLIAPNEIKTFSNVELVYVSSASRPTLKITYHR